MSKTKSRKLQRREQRANDNHSDYATEYVADLHMSGLNTDSLKQSVRDSTFIPDTSSHHRKRELRLRPSHNSSSKQKQPFKGLPYCETGHRKHQMPVMQAFVNGECIETFTSTKNGDSDKETGTPSETGESTDRFSDNGAYNGEIVNKHEHNKPGPKSRKLKKRIPSTDRTDRDGVANLLTNDLDVQERPKVARASPEPDPEPIPNIPEIDPEQMIPETDPEQIIPNIPENDHKQVVPEIDPEQIPQTDPEQIIPDIPENDPKQVIPDNPETEAPILEEEVQAPDEVQEGPKEVDEEEECNIQESVDKHANGMDGLAGSESGNEGIVTEPEDHSSMSVNLSEPDVTISFVDDCEEEDSLDASRSNEEEDVPAEDLTEGNRPLIEFPTDSPDKDSKSFYFDDPTDSEMEGSIETDENVPKTDPINELPLTSSEMSSKILHPIENPSCTRTILKRAAEKCSVDEEIGYSFGKSLRSMSGRRAMKSSSSETIEEDLSPLNKSFSSIFPFAFGKRKAEDPPKEHEPKRAKVEEGVDSLGFFARLTSPVMNRLRGIKVAMADQSQTGEEVNGHEEMAVAIIAPPASKRCVLM